MIVPTTPLSLELEETPWPPRFNVMTLLQYDGESDPEELLMKYKAIIESNGGDATTKAKAFIMALKGPAQHSYTNILKGQISSWFQLRNRSQFHGDAEGGAQFK